MVLRYQEVFASAQAVFWVIPQSTNSQDRSACLKVENYNYVNQFVKLPFALDRSQDTMSYTSGHAGMMFGDFSHGRCMGHSVLLFKDRY